MINGEYIMKTITADIDKYLTQKDENVTIEDRILSKKIYLAVNDSADNYIEIDEAKYKEYVAEKEAKEKEELDKLNK